MLETVLHSTNNYHGFRYIKWHSSNGYQEWKNAGEPDNLEPFLGPEYDRFYYG